MKRGKAGIRKDSWHTWQDEKLTEILLDHARQGLKQKDGIKAASVAIGKSEMACHMRWHNYLKDKVKKMFTLPVDNPVEQTPKEVAEEPKDTSQSDIRIERAGKKWRLLIEANGNDHAAVSRLLEIFSEFSGEKEMGA